MIFKILKISIPVLIILGLTLLYLPLAFPRLFFINTEIYYEGSVDKVVDFNPFYPVIAANQDNGVLDFLYFKRTGIFAFEKYKSEFGNYKYGTTKKELQDTLTRYDLRKETPDESKFTPAIKVEKDLKEFYDKQNEGFNKLKTEMEKPEVCRDMFINGDEGVEMKELFFIKPNMLGKEFGRLIDEYKITTISTSISGQPMTNYKLKKGKSFKLQIYFNRDGDSKITKLVLVDRDCNQTEIPTKPDGTFDFEAVRSKWE